MTIKKHINQNNKIFNLQSCLHKSIDQFYKLQNLFVLYTNQPKPRREVNYSVSHNMRYGLFHYILSE